LIPENIDAIPQAASLNSEGGGFSWTGILKACRREWGMQFVIPIHRGVLALNFQRGKDRENFT